MSFTKSIVAPFYGRLAKPIGINAESTGSAVAWGFPPSPFLHVYPWTRGVGFGSKFANASPLPPGGLGGLVFTSTANAILMTAGVSPFVKAYAWSTAGFGTAFSNPASLPAGITNKIAIRTSATFTNAVGLAHNTTPFITVYRFDSGGWGTKFANPAVLPPNAGTDVEFTHAEEAIILSHATSPFISGWPWSDSGFGTKYANPATLPTVADDMSFSRSDAALAMASSTFATAVIAWAFDNGFGTKYADPSFPVPFSSTGRSVRFGKASIAVGITDSIDEDTVINWQWTDAGGFGTRHTAGPNTPANQVNDIEFNEAGNNIFMAMANEPECMGQSWNDTNGFTTPFYANPSPTLPGTGNAVAVAR